MQSTHQELAFMPLNWAKVRKTKESKCLPGYGDEGHFYTTAGSVLTRPSMEKCMVIPLNITKITAVYFSNRTAESVSKGNQSVYLRNSNMPSSILTLGH